MFDLARSADEARRSEKLASIYHRGQALVWNGREVLAELIARHGGIHMTERDRHALARIFSILMWGELAAWRISAQLADRLEPLEAKMAATGQAHDEARHFYVLHDYLAALGEAPSRPDRHTEAVLEAVLATAWLPAKVLGMQLLIENFALTIFHLVRRVNVEPVLTDLLAYYEKDEARHVGLGVQQLPMWLKAMRHSERVRLFLFQARIVTHTLRALKTLEPDLATLGLSAREIIDDSMSKQEDTSVQLFEELGVRSTVTREILWRGIGAARELVFSAGAPTATRVASTVRMLWHRPDFTASA
jgi:hypothetical protein